ncbi:hypothetical protein ACIRL2_40115 [Embleya sp. NPDC127516]|uniref:DODA-type extradiol aromatic ring-opening family dioxygenase n=1 Tax=Embleya sp. NPDC127516 TaxID=3363990 RepID=UPI00380C8B48
MGTVVGGFVMPHDPMMFTAPDAPPAPVRARVLQAYEEIARHVARLRPTTLVVFGADHYVLFGPGCLPQLLIATGDIDGPVERLPGLSRAQLPDDRRLARHIAGHGHDNGVDWAVAPSITADHSVVIPYHLVGRSLGLPLIPVYLACGVDPLLPLHRAAAAGAALRAAVEAYDQDARVVVIGSGGISHWVGTDRMGEINADFDRHVLRLVCDGDIDALCALDDSDVERRAGNGALEIRTFIAAMSAVGPLRGDVIAYEPVPEWITGLGFASLTPQTSTPSFRTGGR